VLIVSSTVTSRQVSYLASTFKTREAGSWAHTYLVVRACIQKPSFLLSLLV